MVPLAFALTMRASSCQWPRQPKRNNNMPARRPAAPKKNSRGLSQRRYLLLSCVAAGQSTPRRATRCVNANLPSATLAAGENRHSPTQRPHAVTTARRSLRSARIRREKHPAVLWAPSRLPGDSNRDAHVSTDARNRAIANHCSARSPAKPLKCWMSIPPPRCTLIVATRHFST